MNFIRRHKIDLIIFAVALIARLALFGVNLHASQGNLINAIHGDDGYYELSRNVVAGHGFTGESAPPYIPNPLRTPGYILFLAGLLWLTKSYLVTILVQIVLGACIPILGRRIALKLLPDKRVGFWVGMLMALEPYLVLFSSIFYTETLFIFLFLLFVLATLSYLEKGEYRLLVLSGVLLGLATLAKTTVQYLPLIVAPLFFYRFRKELRIKENLIRVGVFLLLYLAVISPWLYRNLETFGVVGLSAQPAYNVYVYMVPSVLAIENGTGFSEELRKWATVDESSGTEITLANGPAYIKKALPVIEAHPRALIELIGISFVTFFTSDGMLTVLQHAGIVPDTYLTQPALTLLFHAPYTLVLAMLHFIGSPIILVLLMRLFWIIVTILFFLGSYVFVKRNGFEAKTTLVLLLVLYFLATTPINGLGVNARFRMPVTAILFTFAASFVFRKGNKQDMLSV